MRRLVPWVLAFILGVAAFFVTMPMPGFFEFFLFCVQTVGLALLLALWGGAGLVCLAVVRASFAKRGRSDEGEAPRTHKGHLAAVTLAGLGIAIVMWPWAWPRFFSLWTEAWRSYIGAGITGEYVDPLRVQQADIALRRGFAATDPVAPWRFSDLSLLFQTHCVVLYGVVATLVQLACYGLVLAGSTVVLRILGVLRRPCTSLSTARVRLAIAVCIFAAMVLWFTLLPFQVYRNGALQASPAQLREQRDETRLRLGRLVTILEHLKTVLGEDEGFPHGSQKDLYAWLVQGRGPEWDETVNHIENETRFLDHVGRTMRDMWGQELRYRCPVAGRPKGYDVYSIGPNGIDEHGAGDDVEVNAMLDHKYKGTLWKLLGNAGRPTPILPPPPTSAAFVPTGWQCVPPKRADWGPKWTENAHLSP
jgi:hypothetical protein